MAEAVFDSDSQKQCTSCKLVKPLDDFPVVGVRAPGKRRAACKECKRAAARKAHLMRVTDYDEYLERRRNLKNIRKYGMSTSERSNFIKMRGNVCEACGCSAEESFGGSLCIDHDHSCCPTEKTCGKCIRGVLCYHCNLAVGYLRDDPVRTRRLAEYLEVTNGGTRRIQEAI